MCRSRAFFVEIALLPLFREKAWQKALLGTIHFPGLRRFRRIITLRLARYVCACGTVRCKLECSPGFRVRSVLKNAVKQGAVLGCAAEAEPAAETAEAEQGPPSKFSSGLRPAQKIWVTVTRSSASVFASPHRSAPKNRLSARGTNAGSEPEPGRWVKSGYAGPCIALGHSPDLT